MSGNNSSLYCGIPEEADVPWNTAATTVERIREQSGLSLTERLKREFGVDASESDDEAKNNGKYLTEQGSVGLVYMINTWASC